MNPETSARIKKVAEAALIVGIGAAAVKTVQKVYKGEEKGQIYFLTLSSSFMVERLRAARGNFARISGQVVGFDPVTSRFEDIEIDEPNSDIDIEEELPGFEALYTSPHGAPELRD